jgi:hypothetical protein
MRLHVAFLKEKRKGREITAAAENAKRWRSLAEKTRMEKGIL